MKFKVGDIVTRGHGDRSRVVYVNDNGENIEVECIVSSSWIKRGEHDFAFAHRYELVNEDD